ITECINNKSNILNLSNLNLDYLPNNLPSSLQTLYCYNNKIKELNNLPSSLQTLYCNNNQIKELNNLLASLIELYYFNNKIKKEKKNNNKKEKKIQRMYKYKKRQKRRKFCKDLEQHATEFRLRPFYPEYLVIKNRYKNVFSDC